MKITLVSDIICPWCYIGKTRLQNAIDALAVHDRVQLEISPFQLYPDIPLAGKSKSLFPKKTGHSGPLKEAGAQLGITFNWHLIDVIPNTLPTHEALLGLQQEVRWGAKTALFQAYFSDGKPLEDPKVVNQILEQYQKDHSVAEVSVNQLMSNNLDRGITVVPSFVIDDEFILKGAIEEERWKAFFKRRLEV